ncbi:hypothetical protein Tco_0969223 [Tanacetum coccineum]
MGGGRATKAVSAKAIKESRKTIRKTTPTTITPTTAIATAIATTTISTSNRTGDMRLLGPMWQPQLRLGVMLGIYQCATVATLTIMDNALQSVRGAKELDIIRTSVQKEGIVRTRELVQEHIVHSILINIAPATLDTSYEVELADGKADEKKLDDNHIVRDFLEVFLDDLTGLPPVREIEFRIDLIPGALSVSDLKLNFEAQAEKLPNDLNPYQMPNKLETHFERRDDGGIYFFDQIWIPSVGGVRKLIMDEAHTTRYSVHLGADKMHYDLRDLY